MNNKEPEFSDELISAYLDCELSSEQQALVEEQLMDNLEHRRMFEELRALRSGLQELPQASLGDDFAQRVLQRAERELLASPAGGNDELSDGESSTRTEGMTSAATVTVRDEQDAGILRGLVWAVAAMAAAIALIVFNPMGQREVAVLDQNVDRAVQSAPTDSTASDDMADAGASLEKGSAEEHDNLSGELAKTSITNH